ncbi:hypothetical protein FH972_004014 [Carpinus fangiana]|uniref:AP2/ERF domain-containing protein n=1 Tax=Carpinus fangiana TaxID=176857 RepID=A0A5N6QK09_9ROSI|nr:hypothetical protein FH972_004014 [Carpinus fangiana]
MYLTGSEHYIMVSALKHAITGGTDGLTQTQDFHLQILPPVTQSASSVSFHSTTGPQPAGPRVWMLTRAHYAGSTAVRGRGLGGSGQRRSGDKGPKAGGEGVAWHVRDGGAGSDDKAAIEFRGARAKLNFPESDYAEKNVERRAWSMRKLRRLCQM